MGLLREIGFRCWIFIIRLGVVGTGFQFVVWLTGRTDEILDWGKHNEARVYTLLFAALVFNVTTDMIYTRLSAQRERETQL